MSNPARIHEVVTENVRRHQGSFRDPNGFIFTRDGIVYRHVGNNYRADYDAAKQANLFQTLWDQGLLIPHAERDPGLSPRSDAFCVLQPQQIPFISYPTEWCFGQLRDAALLTLDVALQGLERGFILKDASAFNVQFFGCSPIFIDTLSFERYVEGAPWPAYRQFCQHFLAPLVLMSYRDVRLQTLARHYIDGVPLDLASHLLPWRSFLSLGVLMHIHSHARAQQRYASDLESAKTVTARRVSRHNLLALFDNLRSVISKLSWRLVPTEWGDYYEHTNYSDDAMRAKEKLVARMVDERNPRTIWDLGSNMGRFSRVVARDGRYVVSADVDPVAVEKNYRVARKQQEKNILPIIVDLTNPTASSGWHHHERSSFLERGPADLVLALALVHHLAVSNNVPLPLVAQFFADAGRDLLIEFVPKSDSQVKRLLASRPDIFPEYTQAGFEAAFDPYFSVVRKEPVLGSERTLYLMTRRTP